MLSLVSGLARAAAAGTVGADGRGALTHGRCDGCAPRYRWWLALFAASLALRVVAMAVSPLVPEEAYYWLYAQNADLSYFDHPPMVAWVIAAGTSIFGDTQLGVRIGGNVLMCAASVAMFIFVRAWYGRTTALLSALALHVLPVYAGVGLIETMDAALLFFWVLALAGFSAALRGGRAWGWYAAGAAAGGALLSKYTGVFLGVGALAAVIGHRPWRAHLRTVHPYLGAAIAAAAFSPVLLWNWRHGWASFRFQFVERFSGDTLGVGNAAAFVGEGFLVATPVILLGAVWLAARGVRRPRRLLGCPRTWLVLCFSVPMLAVMAWKSLRSPIHMNWLVPAYLPLIPASVHLLTAYTRAAQRTQHHREARPTALAWTGAACVALNCLGLVYLLVLQPRLGLIRAFGPWEELAAIVEEQEDLLEEKTGAEPLIIADGKYRLASELAFYRRPLEEGEDSAEFTSNQWMLGDAGLGFPYWIEREKWKGESCIYVDFDGGTEEDLRGHFERYELVESPRLRALGYSVTLCWGYLGPEHARARHD